MKASRLDSEPTGEIKLRVVLARTWLTSAMIERVEHHRAHGEIAKGLRRGDIILGADYSDIGSVADLEQAVRAAENDDRDAILLQLQRRGATAQYFAIRLR